MACSHAQRVDVCAAPRRFAEISGYAASPESSRLASLQSVIIFAKREA
jgi:hypothetical protein